MQEAMFEVSTELRQDQAAFVEPEPPVARGLSPLAATSTKSGRAKRVKSRLQEEQPVR